MTKATTRGLILTVAMLAVCVAAAIPAQAAITPARTRISFTSTNSVLTLDAPFSGGTRCPTAELTVTTDDAGTSASGRVTFSGNTGTRVTCTDSATGNSVTVSCRGIVGISDTLRTSVARTNTSSDLILMGSPACSITNLVTGATVNVDSQTVSSCVTVRENTTVDVRCSLRVTIGVVPAPNTSGTATFTATFSTATNISIS